MSVRGIDHLNIRASNLENTVRFYAESLGMTAAPSPVSGGGTWIKNISGAAVLHLGRAGNFQMPTDGIGGAVTNASGVIHHVAFACSDYDEHVNRLVRLGVPFEVQERPNLDLRQIFVRDPDGVLVELNFESKDDQ